MPQKPTTAAKAPGLSFVIVTLDNHLASAADRARHIAIDIGVEGLGQALATRLDAVFVSQAFSRLVIDCNRDPASSEAIPEDVDGTRVPGNIALSAAERAERIAEVHEAYHRAIAAEIGERTARGQPTVLIALHSFTPVLGGAARPWHVGVLHEGGDERFAFALLEALAQDPALIVGDNEPYHLDATDHSVPRHAFAAGLRYAEIEVRQDLITDAAGQQRWADILAAALERSLRG